jgi:hypothetical protein
MLNRREAIGAAVGALAAGVLPAVKVSESNVHQLMASCQEPWFFGVTFLDGSHSLYRLPADHSRELPSYGLKTELLAKLRELGAVEVPCP